VPFRARPAVLPAVLSCVTRENMPHRCLVVLLMKACGPGQKSFISRPWTVSA
jgi:hypothetical protein